MGPSSSICNRSRRVCDGKFLVLRMFWNLTWCVRTGKVIKRTHEVSVLHRLHCVCVLTPVLKSSLVPSF